MSKERQEIAEKVRDGSYFRDAIEWYNEKYLYPVTERSMMFIFMVAAVVALIPIASFLAKISDSIIKIPFPIYSADLTEHYSVINTLAKEDESPQTAIAEYLIKDYVISREEYIYKNINADSLRNLLKKIKFSSSKQVLNEYVGYMSDTNPYSPITRYKYHTNRYVEIKSLSFLDSDQTSGKSRVVFEAKEVSNDGTTQKSTWEVTLNFRLPDIVTIAKTGSPLRFVVGYYRAKPLDIGPKENEPQDKGSSPESKQTASPAGAAVANPAQQNVQDTKADAAKPAAPADAAVANPAQQNVQDTNADAAKPDAAQSAPPTAPKNPESNVLTTPNQPKKGQ